MDKPADLDSSTLDPNSDLFKQFMETRALPPKSENKEDHAEKKTGDAPTPKKDDEDKLSKPDEDATDDEDVEQASDDDDDDDSPETLKRRIAGLKAELSRRKANAEKLEKLEAQIQELQKKPSESTQTEAEKFFAKLSDDELLSRHTEWEDELADARAALRMAERDEDAKEVAKQQQRVNHAREVLTLFKKEESARVKQSSQKERDHQTEVEAIQAEAESMYEMVIEAYPEFEDKNSKLWKEGDAQYRAHPRLMKQLGPLSQIVATALAIVKSGSPGAPREKILKNVEDGVRRALKPGGRATPKEKPAPTFNVDTPQGRMEFEALVAKLKGGG